MDPSCRTRFNVPNIVNICVDRSSQEGREGRLYCCYMRDAVPFRDEIEIIRNMEKLMDTIGYPQSSTVLRSFRSRSSQKRENLKQVCDTGEILKQRGRIATFLVWVRYRQNSTWQGRLFWMEKDQSMYFHSELELLKRMDGILQITGK